MITNSRFELAVHQRVRSRHELQFPDQVRGGASLRWNAAARFTPFRFRGSAALTTRMAAERRRVHSVRNSGGLRMRVTERLTVETGYLFDFKRKGTTVTVPNLVAKRIGR